ncbi:sporulation histidine kinase inhibitor Sda [Halobacillus litoralis]|uniref:Sporulation histidine kinase inhibitor Sda n=1 Tax=Halobacillus litoralis TaxID=45668 RepID=A0A845E1P6_9BACI|nr:sporulation histidine kinase inhibitor Sda [Halobacillus litoralis]MYL49657.1 sporulation histidine kinase inhibitor Sda [Halobacillus litoralis]
MIIEQLSSRLLKDTLLRAIDLKLEDDFIYLLKTEISKREKEEKMMEKL